MYIGTNRYWSRKIALMLVAIGVLLIPDAVIPTFTDLILNVPLAFVFADLLALDYAAALVLTFIMGFVFVLMGMMIWPYNTKRLLNGRMKSGIRFMISHPILIVFSIISLIIVYFAGQWMYDNLWQYAREWLTAQGVV